jgi:hypothetical protein
LEVWKEKIEKSKGIKERREERMVIPSSYLNALKIK